MHKKFGKGYAYGSGDILQDGQTDSQTDRHTHTQTASSQYFTAAPVDEVKINHKKLWVAVILHIYVYSSFTQQYELTLHLEDKTSDQKSQAILAVDISNLNARLVNCLSCLVTEGTCWFPVQPLPHWLANVFLRLPQLWQEASFLHMSSLPGNIVSKKQVSLKDNRPQHPVVFASLLSGNVNNFKCIWTAFWEIMRFMPGCYFSL